MLRQVGNALIALPETPTDKKIDILLTLIAADGLSLRTVLPEDVVAELLGGRDTPYTINDLMVEFGVDCLHVGHEYARETGRKGHPDSLIGGTILAFYNGLDSVDELVALVDEYRAVLKRDDEFTVWWLSRHPRCCYDFLRLLKHNTEHWIYPENLRKLEDFYASQKYADGGAEVLACDGGGEYDEDDEETEDWN